MRYKFLVTIFIFIIILTGCNTSENKNSNNNAENSILPAFDSSENINKDKTPFSRISLNNEENIKSYLVGEWMFDNDYKSEFICIMNIDENLIVNISFINRYTGENKGEFTGKITFDRLYSKLNEAPDLICIEIKSSDYPGGDFFFKHRTIYDKKRVMSLFLASNGNCIFDKLGNENYDYIMDEIFFEKLTGETSKLKLRNNDEFYAVYWGKGENEETLWIDDVIWEPQKEDDYEAIYPGLMTNYENDISESILYNISDKKKIDILGDDLFPGDVYFVQTNENGDITDFISADYKNYIDNGSITSEIKTKVIDILESNVYEVDEYLNLGMSILFDGETIMLDDEEYYVVSLGTNHEDNFVREIYYAVNVYTEQVYLYDVINDSWDIVGIN